MIATPRDGFWGTDRGTCGAAVMVRCSVPGELRIVPQLCDAWSCALCGARKAAWFKRELKAAQARHQLDMFMTLTVSTKLWTPAESVRLITPAFHRLHRGLTKAHGTFSYVWCLELTKQYRAHLHLLATLRITPGELSARWRTSSGGSFIVDVQEVRSASASNYLAKYCTEQATLRADPAYKFLRGRRFFSTSRDVHFAPFRAQDASKGHESEWQRLRIPYWELMRYLRQKGAAPIERLAVVPSCTVPDGDRILADVLKA